MSTLYALLEQARAARMKLEQQQHVREQSWVHIYDPKTGERVSGCDAATARIRIPSNGRETK